MEIKLLQQLSSHAPLTISQIAHSLNLTTLQALALIADINNINHHLISNCNGQYQLTKPLNCLNKAQISQGLANHGYQHRLYLFDKLASTNSYALNHLASLTDKTIVSCELQFSGRGRFGRQWLSTIAQDLTLSLIYHGADSATISLIPLATAVAINRLLKNYRLASTIKWPNDIYVTAQKVAGILVENVRRGDINYSVIGIGLDNIGNWERNKLMVDLIVNLEQILSELQLFGFALLKREWLDNCLHYQQMVTILEDTKIATQGIHCDISDRGELILQTSSGLQTYSSSRVSLQIDQS